jgi:2-dehydropantoate 2-reductase
MFNLGTPSFGFIGVGALGGYYSTRLELSGQEVHYLLRQDFPTIKAQGFDVKSTQGDFKLKPKNIYDKLERFPQVDILCLSLKSTANSNVLEYIKNASKPGGGVLVLQNGYGLEQEIAREFPDKIILAGLCFLCANRTAPGKIHHLDYGMIKLGSYQQNTKSNLVIQKLKIIFEAALIPIETSPSLLQARWEKLIWNIPFNGLCAILQCDTKELMQSTSIQVLAKEIMLEIQKAAQSDGIFIEDVFIEKMIYNTLKMKAYRPSMLLDLENKRPLEWDSIFQKPIQKALQNQIQMPKTQVLLEQLKFIDKNHL